MVAHSIVVVVLGLVFGSFLFTMADRLQLGVSVMRRSACDSCATTIGVIGLIPVLGFLIQRGRCPACGERISRLYPVYELLNAALAYAIFLKTGWRIDFVHAFLMFESLLLIAVLDFRTKLIFPQPVLAAFLVQCAWLIAGRGVDLLDALIGLFMGAGIFHWISYLYERVRRRVGLGGGDATLLGLIGFAFGWELLFPVIFWSAVFGIAWGGGRTFSGRQSWRDEMAFGPWLVLAAFLIWYFPEFFRNYPFRTSYRLMLQ